jgi:hypothetical protein
MKRANQFDINKIDTNVEYTKVIGPTVVELKPDELTINEKMYKSMLQQRGVKLRDLDRPLPNISYGDKVKTYENPFTRADYALNQITPDAVKNSKDLRFAAISQNESRANLVVDNSPNLLQSFEDARKKYGNGLALDKMVDPKLIYGFNEGAIKVPRRNDDYSRLGQSIYDSRNSQDSSLFTKLGGDTKDYVQKHHRDPITFVTQGMDRSFDSIDVRSNMQFDRSTSNVLMNDPRLTSGMIGSGVLRKAAGFSFVPENSRRVIPN